MPRMFGPVSRPAAAGMAVFHNPPKEPGQGGSPNPIPNCEREPVSVSAAVEELNASYENSALRRLTRLALLKVKLD
jgi:hypothetical protein